MIPACIAATILLTTIAQIVLKSQAHSLRLPTSASEVWPFTISCVANPWLWLVLACALASMISWAIVLTRLPLGVAYPFAGLTFCAILAASWYFLGETPSGLTITGTLIIAAGVAVVGLGMSRAV